MPFDKETKARMFIRSGRICCLCLKQCGTNIEAAHIIDESKGGSNEDENGIPVCFDCHQEIGGYSDDHPKGNKFTPTELKARRDRIYKFVEGGVLIARTVAHQLSSNERSGDLSELTLSTDGNKPSEEGAAVLENALSGTELEALAEKLRILSATDRAFVLDSLTSKVKSSIEAVKAVSAIITSSSLPTEESVVLAEQLVRKVTLLGSIEIKAALLEALPASKLALVDEGVRYALFKDAIQTVKRDQYGEVNKITGPLVRAQDAIPPDLQGPYVIALLEQARSDSYEGAPAARRGLQQMPPTFALAGIRALDQKFLLWHAENEFLRAFLKANQSLVNGASEVVGDFAGLSKRDFRAKYDKDEC